MLDRIGGHSLTGSYRRQCYLTEWLKEQKLIKSEESYSRLSSDHAPFFVDEGRIMPLRVAEL